MPKPTKQLQVDRELKRLLRVLNHPTLLFPVIRSIIAGEFIDEDGTRHILILTNINDFMILENSVRKKSREIKKAWVNFKTYCGKSEEIYDTRPIPIYSVNEAMIEFVEAAEIIRFLEENLDAYECYVGTVELFGVQVKVLRELSILETVPMEEEYTFVVNGKKTLKDAAYLNYRKHLLKSLDKA